DEQAADFLALGQAVGDLYRRRCGGEDVEGGPAAAAHRADGGTVVNGVGFVRVVGTPGIALLLLTFSLKKVGIKPVTVRLHGADDDFPIVSGLRLRCALALCRFRGRRRRLAYWRRCSVDWLCRI